MYLWRFIKKGLILCAVFVAAWLLMLVISCIAHFTNPDDKIWENIWNFFKFYNKNIITVEGHKYSYADIDITIFVILFAILLLLPFIFNLIYVWCKFKTIKKLVMEKEGTNFHKDDCRFFLVSQAYNIHMGKLYGRILDNEVASELVKWKGVCKFEQKKK